MNFFAGEIALGTLSDLWNSLDFSAILSALMRLIAVFLCLTVHETCHGLAALALGDPTAKSMHRLSLNPPAGTISTSSYAGMNGSYLNNAFIEKRNVVISFAMRGIGIEKRRHQLYHVVKPSRYIKIWYKTANIDVYAEGYVETCEVSNFEQQISGQISILCPDIYWYSRDIFYAYYSGITGAFHFPFPESDAPFPLGVYSNSNLFSITNDGDETGFTLKIEALPSDIPQEVVAVTPTIYNENGEYLQIKGDILTGDVITVTTKTGNKTVTLTRNGVDSNILNRLVSGSTWLTLKEGTNTFRVEAVRGVKKLRVTLMHRNSYLGV